MTIALQQFIIYTLVVHFIIEPEMVDKEKNVLASVKYFPGGSDGKEPTYNVRDLASIPGSGRSPGGGHGNPLQHSCLENPHGQRSLVGYSPWTHKESDMTG